MLVCVCMCVLSQVDVGVCVHVCALSSGCWCVCVCACVCSLMWILVCVCVCVTDCCSSDRLRISLPALTQSLAWPASLPSPKQHGLTRVCVRLRACVCVCRAARSEEHT